MKNKEGWLVNVVIFVVSFRLYRSHRGLRTYRRLGTYRGLRTGVRKKPGFQVI